MIKVSSRGSAIKNHIFRVAGLANKNAVYPVKFKFQIKMIFYSVKKYKCVPLASENIQELI